MTWTQLALVVGIGYAIAGKKDLPRAARWVGTHLGRLVGFLQGAKARADRYTQQNEMRALQNELRSGLRELDAVRAELTQTLTRPMGRDLGSTVSGANRMQQSFAAGATSALAHGAGGVPPLAAPPPTDPSQMKIPSLPNADSASMASPPPSQSSYKPFRPATAQAKDVSPPGPLPSHAELAPTKHAIGAIAEEEWSRQGIGFKSRAEMGSGLPQQSYDHSVAGSTVLSNLLQQSLVFDQYDRVTQEQDQLIRGKMDAVQQKVQKEAREKQEKQDGSKDNRPKTQ